MRNLNGFYFFVVILLLIDSYIFFVIKNISIGLAPKTRNSILAAFILLSILMYVMVLVTPKIYFIPQYRTIATYGFSMVIGVFIFKLIAVLFFLIDDVRRLCTFATNKIANTHFSENNEGTISRSSFLTWLGIGIGGSVFGSLVLGFGNKYNYRVKQIKLRFANLPTAFKGLRIVQLSDIHSGSFDNKEAVAKGVQKVLDLKPDLILFTGDLVNNIADEMLPYKDVFAKLTAPMGVYSVLGNHDYGDYYFWPDRDEAHLQKEKVERERYLQQLLSSGNFTEDEALERAKFYRLYAPQQQQNIDKLKQIQADMGWRLLLNEHVVLEKENEKIAVIGIENFGARGNFPKYGRLDIAHKGTEHIPFKILMSHDPSHWDFEVKKKYKDIQLTLSGHTHGMQYGVEIPWLKWSPIQYVYKQWAGIYEDQKQQLYVNRGFGFLGYPGRVGILPEITLMEFI
jgi:hypothetical protein